MFNSSDKVPEDDIIISELINIESEYRCFVYNNRLVGIQYYSGDFKIFPNVEKIEKMINAYYNYSPIAYTLDVAISDGETVIIECHDFFSCGLYGFSDLKILPYMFWRWFNEYMNSNHLYTNKKFDKLMLDIPPEIQDRVDKMFKEIDDAFPLMAKKF